MMHNYTNSLKGGSCFIGSFICSQTLPLLLALTILPSTTKNFGWKEVAKYHFMSSLEKGN